MLVSGGQDTAVQPGIAVPKAERHWDRTVGLKATIQPVAKLLRVIWGSGGAGPHMTQPGRAGSSGRPANPRPQRTSGTFPGSRQRGTMTWRPYRRRRGNLARPPFFSAQTRPHGSPGQRGDGMAPLRWATREYPSAAPGEDARTDVRDAFDRSALREGSSLESVETAGSRQPPPGPCVPRTVLVVAGARPNFMKVAPLLHEMRKHPDIFRVLLIHTGQHYDSAMSDAFFADLDLPAPDRFLGVGSGTHAEQTASVMVAFEKVCVEESPGLVIVVGDVNSTIAAAITAKKLCIPVAHVEAGLRSRDWTMPEEINRVVTDAISDLLFTPSPDANANLLKEGIPAERIHFVGNIMIDALAAARPKAGARETYRRLGCEAFRYGLVTLHRPSNVDSRPVLAQILEALVALSRELPLLVPIHPRTRKNLSRFGLDGMLGAARSLRLVEPQGYLDFLNLEMHARMVITDSGGVQEETTWLGIPCLTLRENTERPVTVWEGTNRLVQPQDLAATARRLLAEELERPPRPPALWDGQTAGRIYKVLGQYLLS